MTLPEVIGASIPSLVVLYLYGRLATANRAAAHYEKLWRRAVQRELDGASADRFWPIVKALRHDHDKLGLALADMTHERDVWRDATRNAIAYYRDHTRPLPIELTRLLEEGERE